MNKRCGLLCAVLLGALCGGALGPRSAVAAPRAQRHSAHTKPYAPAVHRPAKARPAIARPKAARRRILPLIVIDPGHGGRDAGAVGASGLLEKDVTMATALDLQQALRATGGFQVVLTRSHDTFVSLGDRVARAHGAALFISIHADASPDHHAKGASVYVRADTAGGSKVTKLPASSANAGAIGHALSARPAPGSMLLQNTMVEQLRDDVAMVRDPARRAHLFVLGAVGVPGVLVEMGFLSNRQEERSLRTKPYRRVIARAIRDAIGDYFDDLRHESTART